jgi:hypothetical protein
MDIAGYHIPGLAAAAATFGAVFSAFARFDKDQSDDNRRFVRNWIVGIKVDNERWSQFFQEIFSQFFGSKHLSLKCVRRSFALSSGIITVIFLLLMTEAVINGEIWSYDPYMVVFWWILALPCACIADYFSLWKTRFFLTRKISFRSVSAAIAVVIVDFLTTCLILEIIWFIIFGSYWTAVKLLNPDLPWNELLSVALFGPAVMLLYGAIVSITQGPQAEYIGFWLYAAALLTSAWLWVYLIVAYGIRGLNLLLRRIEPLSNFMDFDNHPVRTIGYAAATISAAIVGIISLI